MSTLYETVRGYVAEFKSKASADGKPYAHFLNTFYGTHDTLDTSDSSPDIGGYVLAFLKPPELSGLSGFSSSNIAKARNSVFFIQDVTPPESSINTSQISSGSNISIPFATGKTSGGQLSISYLENHRLDIYALHHTWFHYIEQVLRGEIDPSSSYIESGELDYATSAYIVKYKPNMQDMVYIGKMIGIFPINLPNKEIIGSRNQNQVSVYNINYMCTDYREVVVDNNTQLDSDWILTDFKNDVLGSFN